MKAKPFVISQRLVMQAYRPVGRHRYVPGGRGRRGGPGVAPLVVPLDEGAARRKRRPGHEMPEHDSRLERHAQSAATRRVAQRAHVDAKFRGQRLEGPQSSGVFAGRQGPSLG